MTFLKKIKNWFEDKEGEQETILSYDKDSLSHWTCHICGKDRPDEFIGVKSGTKEYMTVNIRYCKDNLSCESVAKTCASKVEFPT